MTDFSKPVLWRLMVALLLPLGCQANTGDKYSMNIDISGTVVANGSCLFNQGGTLSVDFGQVRLQGSGVNTVQLDGDYLKPLASSFTCTGDTAGLLQMQFTSSTGSYITYNNSQVMATNKNIVAIQLLVNGVAQDMGEWFSIDNQNPPTLQAKLVQVSNNNSSNVVSGDVFNASGTLMMAFN